MVPDWCRQNFKKVMLLADGGPIGAVFHGTTQSQKSYPRDDERAKKVVDNMMSSNAASKIGDAFSKVARNPSMLRELFESGSVEAAQNVNDSKKDK